MKKYCSELLCITSNNQCDRFIEWLYWHACIIKFNHIIVINNDSTFDLEKVCRNLNKKYKTNIDCFTYHGAISQAKIYTEYCNKSEAYYFLPIDDDEYLYIGDEYNNDVNEFLYKTHQNYPAFYKYAINSYYAFADNIIQKCEDKDFFSLYDRLYVSNEIKCLINTNLPHYYQQDTIDKKSVSYNNGTLKDVNYNIDYVRCLAHKYMIKTFYLYGDHLGSPHNPITKLYGTFQHAIEPQINAIIPGMYNYFIDHRTSINTSAFIYHFKWRSAEEYKYKITKRRQFSDLSIPYSNLFYNMNIYYQQYALSQGKTQQITCGSKLFNKVKDLIDYDALR